MNANSNLIHNNQKLKKKTLRCPSTGKWLDEMWHTNHVMETAQHSKEWTCFLVVHGLLIMLQHSRKTQTAVLKFIPNVSWVAYRLDSLPKSESFSTSLVSGTSSMISWFRAEITGTIDALKNLRESLESNAERKKQQFQMLQVVSSCLCSILKMTKV